MSIKIIRGNEKLFKQIKKKIFSSRFMQKYAKKYGQFETQGCKPDYTEILNKIMIYEKARTLIKDDIFNIQYEDNIIKFYLPNATTDAVQRSILYTDKFFEQDLLSEIRKYINSNTVVLDAGSNIGNHTIFFSKICKAKKVISFEPLKTVFNILEKNLELNDINNIEKYNFALGEKECRASIYGYDSISIGSTQFEFNDNGDFKVISLDSLDLSELDFCKVDVEGGQLEFLKGAKNTLEKFKPTVWIEMLTEEISMFGYDEEKEVILPQKFLIDLGYVLVDKLSTIDYLYIHESKL